MTHLSQAMLEELQRRNYAASTIAYYIRNVEQFARFFKRSPDRLNPTHLRTYQAYLLRERKLAPRTVKLHVCAIRFFFVKTLEAPLSARGHALPEGPTPAAADPERRGRHAHDRGGAQPLASHDADAAVLDRHAERGAAASAGARTSTAGAC